MTGAPPIDLDAAFEAHVASVLADRDAPEELHASDLHACAFALHQRVHGKPRLPFDADTFAMFERGHAYESRVDEAIGARAEIDGLHVTHGEVVKHEGIVGNVDWVLYDRGLEPPYHPRALAVIDLSTTAGKTADWKYGHALKSAFYAVAVGAPRFCEYVLRIGFGGVIKEQRAHWFDLDEEFDGETWRYRVDFAILRAKGIAGSDDAPFTVPPYDPIDRELEAWRCGKPGSGKSYCQCATCPMNAGLPAAERAALTVANEEAVMF